MDNIQKQIQAFVTQTLQQAGVPFRQTADGLYIATVPPHLRRWFANRAEVSFTFDQALKAEHPESDLLAPGAAFLESLVRLVRNQSGVAEIHLPAVRTPGPRGAEPFPVPLASGRVIRLSEERRYEPLLHCTVRVDMTNDEKWVLTHNVLIDLTTGTVIPDGTGVPAEYCREPLAGFDVSRPGNLELEMAYTRAMESVRAAVAPAIADREREAEARLVREIDLLGKYYSAPSEATARQRKAENLKEKYALTVSLSLATAVLVHRPVMLWLAEVAPIRERGPVVTATVWVDLSTGGLVGPDCPICHGQVTRLHYCDAGHHLHCDLCAQTCTGCGREHCHDHPLLRCAVCGNGLCPGCAARCPDCGAVTCREHQHPCSTSPHHWVCPSCVRTCDSCGKASCAEHLTACGHGHDHQICPACQDSCTAAGEVLCPDHRMACAYCGGSVCSDHSGTCSCCDGVMCHTHLTGCITCGDLLCEKDRLSCHIGGEALCPDHAAGCPACGRLHCVTHTHTCKVCQEAYCHSCLTADGLCEECARIQPVARTSPDVLCLLPAIPLWVRPLYRAWWAGKSAKRLVVVADGPLGTWVWLCLPDGSGQRRLHRISRESIELLPGKRG